MKIAFVIGHHKKSKGAFSEYLGMSEWDFYNKVMDCFNEANIFYHDSNIIGYTNRVRNTASKLNKFPFDLVIELHFNSAHYTANGCETLYYFKSVKGKEYAKKFSDVVHRETGIKLRNGGLKALVNKNDRGFGAVYYPKAPTILIEPFFGSNALDCAKIENHKKMAEILKIYVEEIKKHPL